MECVFVYFVFQGLGILLVNQGCVILGLVVGSIDVFGMVYFDSQFNYIWDYLWCNFGVFIVFFVFYFMVIVVVMEFLIFVGLGGGVFVFKCFSKVVK